MHVTPHAPQFCDVANEVQTPLQHPCPPAQQQVPTACVPLGHWQEPPTHTFPVGHLLPQEPQLLASVLVFTHVLLQHFVPVGQQFPFAQQSRPFGQHGFPGAHSLLPDGQLHFPFTQLRPPLHTSPQSLQLVFVPSIRGVQLQHFSPAWIARPHEPQFDELQTFVHTPLQHISVKGSQGAAPHEPQNSGSLFRSAQWPLQSVYPGGHWHTQNALRVIRQSGHGVVGQPHAHSTGSHTIPFVHPGFVPQTGFQLQSQVQFTSSIRWPPGQGG